MIERLREGMRSLREENAVLQARIAELESAMAFHRRAAKLMQKRKPFIVIAEDEPYYWQVYGMIRAREMEIDRWTAEDEDLYWQAYKRLQKGR